MPQHPSIARQARSALERITKITESSALALINYAIGHLDERMPQLSGTGCVIVAGGPYLPPAYASVYRLRELGWNQPVQIWHLGEKEITSQAREKFGPLEVEFVDAQKVCEQYPMRILNGWTVKGMAVTRSPFRHVLLLDADSYAQRNMKELFMSRQYNETGLVLTPDINKNRPNDNIFPMLGIKIPLNYREGESGQILCDKVRSWKPLQLMNFLNSHSDFFYRHFHGDKETWPLAWMRMNVPFHMTPNCAWIDDGMQHYWFDGTEYTHHACHPKRGGTYREDIQELINEYLS